jgi:hypothetical protein
MLRTLTRSEFSQLSFARFVRHARRAVSLIAVGLFLCVAALPVLADDDEKAPPPSAGEVAAAGRVTTAILSLATGFIVFYAFQRHRALNFDKHPPEWDKRMGRNAVLFALISAAAVGGVTAALSRPPSSPSNAAPAEAPKPLRL